VDLAEPANEPADLFNLHLIPNDEESLVANPAGDASIADPLLFPQNDRATEGDSEGAPPTSAPTKNTPPHVIDFLEGEGELCLPMVEETEDNKSKLDNPMHELLLYHFCLAHEPFKYLQQMAKDGILPKRIAHC
jgi:hypothetical protein